MKIQRTYEIPCSYAGVREAKVSAASFEEAVNEAKCMEPEKMIPLDIQDISIEILEEDLVCLPCPDCGHQLFKALYCKGDKCPQCGTGLLPPKTTEQLQKGEKLASDLWDIVTELICQQTDMYRKDSLSRGAEATYNNSYEIGIIEEFCYTFCESGIWDCYELEHADKILLLLKVCMESRYIDLVSRFWKESEFVNVSTGEAAQNSVDLFIDWLREKE